MIFSGLLADTKARHQRTAPRHRGGLHEFRPQIRRSAPRPVVNRKWPCEEFDRLFVVWARCKGSCTHAIRILEGLIVQQPHFMNRSDATGPPRIPRRAVTPRNPAENDG